MTRERLGFRLLSVVLLLILPILVFGWLFFRQSTKDIAFAEKEIAGLNYLNVIAPVFSGILSDDGRPTEVAISRFASAAKMYDGTLETHSQSAELIRLVQAGDRELAINAARELITRVGDRSNLILDPDLDSYYMMDVVVLRMPELVQNGQLLAQPDLLHRLHGMHEDRFHAAQYASSIVGLQRALQAAYGNNPAKNLRFELDVSAGRFIQSAQSLKTALQNSNTSAVGENVNLQKAHSDFEEQSLAFWSAASGSLSNLLEVRISSLKRKLWWAMAISVLIATIALTLAFGVLKHILHRLDDRILYLAHRDVLTGLYNRAAITEAIEKATKAASEGGPACAVHLVDLDRFKWINDTLGHHVGDEVIKEAGRRLADVSGGAYMVGRLGGDEFAVLQTQVRTPEQVSGTAEMICKVLREPYSINGHVLRASGSVGLAMSPDHAKDESTLMRCADLALYKAKGDRENGFALFDPSLAEEMSRRNQLEDAVRHATEREKFRLAFQPIFDTQGIKLIGFEALLRLKDQNGDNISPATFVPVAEKLGLINTIGAWVIREACNVAAHWPDDLTVAVNLSSEQFREPGLNTIIKNALVKSGLKPSRLEVEITESQILENSKSVMIELEAIRSIGVSIAMDDFGTGYSSLAYLLRFPFSRIKIDRSLMLEVESGKHKARTVLEAIVDLGHRLNMRVTAEGVETHNQALVLSELKCDEIQGFLYGKPMPEVDVAELILRNWQQNNMPEKFISSSGHDTARQA